MLTERAISQFLDQPLSSFEFNDVQWKAEESTNTSLLFYRLSGEEKAQEQFRNRILKSSFAWLIVNCHHPDLPENSTIVDEEKWPELQKKLLDDLYPLPDLKLIGITGTNGKTTTADLVLQLGELIGKKGMSIGTLGVRENHQTLIEFGLTSPTLIDLRKFLFKYGKDKDFCVIEVSSHALTQKRVFGLCFDGAGWPSFSQDHLDYHQSMEKYFEAKCLLLSQLKEKAKAYIPADQEELFKLVSKTTKKAKKAKVLKDDLPLFFQTKFNKNNLEVAVSIIEDVFQIPCQPDWTELTPPDGRFYIRSFRSNFIIVDFAHTPDALENICKAIREAFPQHRLKVLFGCGGDRDRGKRPLMGSVAEKWADEIYLTSDNPRSEEAESIIDDIAKGIRQKKFRRITDRSLAVKNAFLDFKEKEVLLLAGKGHEDYLLIKGVKHPYSDIREVENFLERNSL